MAVPQQQTCNRSVPRSHPPSRHPPSPLDLSKCFKPARHNTLARMYWLKSPERQRLYHQQQPCPPCGWQAHTTRSATWRRFLSDTPIFRPRAQDSFQPMIHFQRLSNCDVILIQWTSVKKPQVYYWEPSLFSRPSEIVLHWHHKNYVILFEGTHQWLCPLYPMEGSSMNKWNETESE